MAAVLLRGGQVVNVDGVQRVDVLVQGEKVAAIGADLVAPEGAEVIDVSGKLLVPGPLLLSSFFLLFIESIFYAFIQLT